MLNGVRVLDLCDEKGLLCAKVFADMGAEVIVIEPPQGTPIRRMGPFYQDEPHLEKSLYWLAYNTNKKSVTLNIDSEDGRAILYRLVASADIIVESFPPGFLSSLGFSYKELKNIRPGIILTSITPFGQDGPHKDLVATDLTCWAMSGFCYITGDPDRPPVQISFPQAYLTGSLEAATATLLALYHRELTGEGQHVDVSIQARVTRNMMNAPLFWQASGTNIGRAGPFRVGLSVAAAQRVIWRCKDGEVAFFMWGGMTGYRVNQALVQYMDEEGMAPEFMKQIDWAQFDISTTSAELFEKFSYYIGKFFMQHTKAELFEEAIKRGITLYPIQTVADIVNDPHLESREAWQKIEHPEWDIEIFYPRLPFILSEEMELPKRRAPFLGEHNIQIYHEELGFSLERLAAMKEVGVI